MAFYYSTQSVIEAMEFTEEMKDRVYNWIRCNKAADFDEDSKPILTIQTSEGKQIVRLGDYIINDEELGYFAYNPMFFKKMYVEIAEQQNKKN
jgi:hypothetical protein